MFIPTLQVAVSMAPESYSVLRVSSSIDLCFQARPELDPAIVPYKLPISQLVSLLGTTVYG